MAVTRPLHCCLENELHKGLCPFCSTGRTVGLENPLNLARSSTKHKDTQPFQHLPEPTPHQRPGSSLGPSCQEAGAMGTVITPRFTGRKLRLENPSNLPWVAKPVGPPCCTDILPGPHGRNATGGREVTASKCKKERTLEIVWPKLVLFFFF